MYLYLISEEFDEYEGHSGDSIVVASKKIYSEAEIREHMQA